MQTPLTFTPLLKVRVWGGESLKKRGANPPSEPVGETWELVDHDSDQSIVVDGVCAGKTLNEMFREDAAGLCGQAINPASPEVFPLLLKIIEAEADLSVQVHPDDAYAGRAKPGELGKTEAWYVIAAKPDGRIYRGLKPGVTRETLAAACAAGTVENCLESFVAQPGDVVFIPAGTVHALGAGVSVIEIQQNSDTTYRVFDWNRVGLDGQPRDLHIEDALAVIDFSAAAEACCAATTRTTPGCRHEQFVASDKFSFERLCAFAAEAVRLDTSGERFHILTIVRGEVTITTATGTVSRSALDSALIPASTGAYSLHASPDAEVLLFYVS